MKRELAGRLGAKEASRSPSNQRADKNERHACPLPTLYCPFGTPTHTCAHARSRRTAGGGFHPAAGPGVTDPAACLTDCPSRAASGRLSSGAQAEAKAAGSECHGSRPTPHDPGPQRRPAARPLSCWRGGWASKPLPTRSGCELPGVGREDSVGALVPHSRASRHRANRSASPCFLFSKPQPTTRAVSVAP